jgi:hypothetical protein
MVAPLPLLAAISLGGEGAEPAAASVKIVASGFR